MAAEPSLAAPPKPAPEPMALLLHGGWPCAACTMANAAHAAACALCYAPRAHAATFPEAAEASPRPPPPLADPGSKGGNNNGGPLGSRRGPFGQFGGGSGATVNGIKAGNAAGSDAPRPCAACRATKGRGDFTKTQW